MALEYGVCYNPAWPSWRPGAQNNGPDAQLSDADFVNVSFQALWNTGSDGSGNARRNDLGTLGGAGVTLLRLYNWGPTRGWNGSAGMEHLAFLDYARSQGMRVIVPISNWFLSDNPYAWNRQNPASDYAFGSAPAAIQTALSNFLGSVTDPSTGKLHAAVHSFSVGNEFDYWTLADQGGPSVDPTSRLARVLWWTVNLQGQITARNLGKALLTIPISNGDQGDPGTKPVSYWFTAFMDGVTAGAPLPQGTNSEPKETTFRASWKGLGGYPWYAEWFYNSVNLYQYGNALSETLGQYDQWKPNSINHFNWPGRPFPVPLLLTEIGVTRARPSTPANQAAQCTQVIQSIAKPLQRYVAANPSTRLMGFCFYGFNDEGWVGADWGLFMNDGAMYQAATGTTNVGYATWPSLDYPVERLAPVTDSTTGKTLIRSLSAIFGKG